MRRRSQASGFDPILGVVICAVIAIGAFFYRLSTGHSQENRGISWLGQMCHEKTKCSVIERSFEGVATINTGWLYTTFNPNRCKCSPVVLQDSRPKRVRVAICNSTCFPERGRRCQKFECFAGMTGRQASRAILNDNSKVFQRIDRSISLAKADLSTATPPLELFVQPCLECSISRDARRKLNEYVAAQFPGVAIVDNPVGGKCLPGYVCEVHGNVRARRGSIVDLDGVDYSKIDKRAFWRKNNQALMALAWKPCANGISGGAFQTPISRSRFCSQSDAVDFNNGIRGINL
jgi:hypothetical protein